MYGQSTVRQESKEQLSKIMQLSFPLCPEREACDCQVCRSDMAYLVPCDKSLDSLLRMVV